jgi:hypothetical protein
LPQAAAVVITWAEAEWAAMQHVFCAGGSPMPYSDRERGTWPGWQKYASHLPAHPPSGWNYWGYYRLATLGTAGGAKPADHIGTVRAVSSGTLYESGQPQASWPEYTNAWSGSNAVLGKGHWGSAVYDAYGFYTSFNGALAAWALLES